VHEGVVDERAADLQHALPVAERDAGVRRAHLERPSTPAGHGGELVGEVLGDRAERDGLAVEPHRPCVEAGEIEEVGRELREALDLLGRRLEELGAGLRIELLVAEQLEEAAER
jgi:hypothetical protein